MTTKQTFQEGYRRNEDGHGWEIIANHEIHGVTPIMIDWWWDNINTTQRYKLWHPTDHISFQWLIPPTNGHVGAVHRVEEYLNGNGLSATLEIRWEDAKKAEANYDHVLLATVQGDAQGSLMHEYEAAPFGTRMCSHFSLAPETPEEIIKDLYEHNKQEMSNFATFLPGIYHVSISQAR